MNAARGEDREAVEEGAETSVGPRGGVDLDAPYGRCRHCHQPLPAARSAGRALEFCRAPRNCRTAFNNAKRARTRNKAAALAAAVEAVDAVVAAPTTNLVQLLELLTSVQQMQADLQADLGERAEHDRHVQVLINAADDADERADEERGRADEENAARRTAETRAQEAEARAERAEADKVREVADHQLQRGRAEERADRLQIRADTAEQDLRDEVRRHGVEKTALTAQLAETTRERDEQRRLAETTRVQLEILQSAADTAAREASTAAAEAAAQLATRTAELDAARTDLAIERDARREAEQLADRLGTQLHQVQQQLTAAQASSQTALDLLNADLDRARTTADAQRERAAIAEAARGIALPQGLTIPEIEDVEGVPGILLGDAGAVLIEDGQIVAVRAPEAQPLHPREAARLGVALLTAAAATLTVTLRLVVPYLHEVSPWGTRACPVIFVGSLV